MALSYDPSSPISFDSSLLKDDFIDYVNEYSNKVSLKGAKCYFSFSPMNEKALQNYSEENTLAFYKALKSKLKFPVISNPNDYIMDSMYFYDTNYHLNNAGAAIRTNTLINDINRNIGVYTLSNIPIPEIVDDSGNSEPSEEETAVKNFEHADYFEYETIDGSLSIKSVKDEYKDVEELKIPSEYNGQVVKVIQANAFEKCTNLKKISIYSGLQSIIPGAFSGCDKLVGIYLYVGADKVLIDHTGGLLKGADNCSIYVLKEYYTDYVSSYFWGYYVSLIKTFEWFNWINKKREQVKNIFLALLLGFDKTIRGGV